MPLNRKPQHIHYNPPWIIPICKHPPYLNLPYLYLESSVGRRADRLLQLVKGLTGARNRAQVRAHPCFTVIADTHVSNLQAMYGPAKGQIQRRLFTIYTEHLSNPVLKTSTISENMKIFFLERASNLGGSRPTFFG